MIHGILQVAGAPWIVEHHGTFFRAGVTRSGAVSPWFWGLLDAGHVPGAANKLIVIPSP